MTTKRQHEAVIDRINYEISVLQQAIADLEAVRGYHERRIATGDYLSPEELVKEVIGSKEIKDGNGEHERGAGEGVNGGAACAEGGGETTPSPRAWRESQRPEA